MYHEQKRGQLRADEVNRLFRDDAVYARHGPFDQAKVQDRDLMKKDIYYQTLKVGFKKDKTIYTREVYCLSHSEDVGLIAADNYSMAIIAKQCYPKTYKGDVKIIIKEIIESKLLWKSPTNT